MSAESVNDIPANEGYLPKDHPAFVALQKEMKVLERNGFTESEPEFEDLVSGFVRANPDLSRELANEVPFIAEVLDDLDGAAEASPKEPNESSPEANEIYSRALIYAQEISSSSSSLVAELLKRDQEDFTPLISAEAFHRLKIIGPGLEDSIRSKDFKGVVDAVGLIGRVVDSIEVERRNRVKDDSDSLKKLSFHLEEIGQRLYWLAKAYGELDSSDALEVADAGLRASGACESRLDELLRLRRLIEDYSDY